MVVVVVVEAGEIWGHGSSAPKLQGSRSCG